VSKFVKDKGRIIFSATSCYTTFIAWNISALHLEHLIWSYLHRSSCCFEAKSFVGNTHEFLPTTVSVPHYGWLEFNTVAAYFLDWQKVLRCFEKAQSSALRSRPCRCNCCATAGDFDSRVSKGQSKARKTQWSFHYSMLSDAFRQMLSDSPCLFNAQNISKCSRFIPAIATRLLSCVLCTVHSKCEAEKLAELRPSRRSAVPNAPDGQTLWWTSTRGLKFGAIGSISRCSERSQNVQSLHVLCVEEKFTSDLLSTIKLPKNAIEKSPVTVLVDV